SAIIAQSLASVARIERSEIRAYGSTGESVPGFRFRSIRATTESQRPSPFEARKSVHLRMTVRAHCSRPPRFIGRSLAFALTYQRGFRFGLRVLPAAQRR